MPELTSAELRQQGNSLYKQAKLHAAIEKYRAAIDVADAEDPLPVSNLSAALFELGDYNGSFEAALQAQSRNQQAGAPDVALKKKLSLRIAQSMLNFGHLPAAAKLPVDDFHPRSLSETCARTVAVNGLGTKDDTWRAIWTELARYKPILYDTPLWSVYGHDNFQSMWHDDLAKQYNLSQTGKHDALRTAPSQMRTRFNYSDESVSFFFGGVGDGRHILQTLTLLTVDYIFSSKDSPVPRVLMVANDFKPHVLARNLIIWSLMDRLIVAKATRIAESE